MHVAEAIDFPFVEGMPKREKSRVAQLWDRLQELKAITDEKGAILPAGFASKLVGVSKQRVNDLMKAGRLERVEVDGHPFVTERSIVEYAKSERKAGRPVSAPKTNKELWAISKAHAKEMVGKK
jgi:hypothetical protein